jgi:hypothetical protein
MTAARYGIYNLISVHGYNRAYKLEDELAKVKVGDGLIVVTPIWGGYKFRDTEVLRLTRTQIVTADGRHYRKSDGGRHLKGARTVIIPAGEVERAAVAAYTEAREAEAAAKERLEGALGMCKGTFRDVMYACDDADTVDVLTSVLYAIRGDEQTLTQDRLDTLLEVIRVATA